jgi:hypothetical protein
MKGKRQKSWIGRKLSRLRLFEDPLGEAATTAPEMIELPGEGRAVEIFVGTAPDLARATRVLVWSLMQVRDPARRYRVHLMANQKGIDRTGWRTGYQGYAKSVNGCEGGAGRAIYCDATMIFVADPAALFDAASSGLADLTGDSVPAIWHQRGDAALAEGAGRVKATAWADPVGADAGAVSPRIAQWRALEAGANAAGYLMFTKDAPTREFGELIGLYQQMHDEDYFPGTRLKHHVEPVSALLAETGATIMLDYGSGKAEGYQRVEGEGDLSPWRQSDKWPGVTVRCYDPGVSHFAEISDDKVGGVISTDVVEHLAPLDVAWVLDQMFARADSFVFVVAACYPAIKSLPDGRNAHTTVQTAEWWRDQMTIVGHRHPHIKWRVGCDMKSLTGKRTEIHGGVGPKIDG